MTKCEENELLIDALYKIMFATKIEDAHRIANEVHGKLLDDAFGPQSIEEVHATLAQEEYQVELEESA